MKNQSNNSNVHFAFRPRARIMRTLGNELISNDIVAVIELVKNAYDADAKKVLIRFLGPLKAGNGAIEIIDNGSGMSLEIVRKAWLEPATPNKRLETKSSTLGRRVLGEKGIGRFAAMRLSEELIMFTRTTNSAREVYGYFNWDQFDDPNKYLDEILLLTEERIPVEITPNGSFKVINWDKSINPSKSLSKGTLLRMSKLKHSWGNDEFTDLQRGLARLISPFFENNNFQIRLEVPGDFAHFSDQIAPPTIIKHPHYSVKGNVKSNGQCNITFSLHTNGESSSLDGGFVRTKKNTLQYVDKDTFNEVLEANERLRKDLEAKNDLNEEKKTITLDPQCGSIDIELRIWDRDELGNLLQSIPQSNLSSIKEDLNSIAGINIYRDGFRVLPYGEPNNDWLRLDIRRVQTPAKRLSNNQIVGYVAITADGNPNLTDQSNRQGLDENLAYSDLKEIMLATLNKIENLRKAARKPTEPTGKDKETIQKSLFEKPNFSEIREHVSSTYPLDTKTNELITVVENQFSKQLEEIKSVVSRYHSLATLGQLIDVLLHDGRQPISSISGESLLGKEDIDEASYEENTILSQLHKRFSTIYSQCNILKTAFRRIEPFGGRKKGRPAQLYLEKIIEAAFDIFSSQLSDSGIKVELPDTLTLVKIDPSEFQEVLINLLQNSIYWLQFADKGKRKIAVSVTRNDASSVEIIFGDTGPGIPNEDRLNIFEPYYSTKPNGIGLGLAIVGEIISDYYDGSLELMDNSKLGGAVFKITLRKRV